MEILLITPGFPKDEKDFQCIPPLQLFVNELGLDTSFKIKVISLHYPATSRPYKWHNIDIVPVGAMNSKGPKRLFARKKLKLLVEEFTKSAKKGIIHSFWLDECTWLAASTAANTSIPHVATAMGQDVLPTNKYLKKIPFDQLRVTAVSGFAGERLLENISLPQIDIIPWGIPDGEIIQAPVSDRPIDLIGVGSLIPLKQFDRFIRVVSLLRDDFPHIRAAIIGDGPEQESLKKMVIKWGLEKHVEFKGAMDREKVLELMSRSKVLLHCSEYESQGFVMNEALARGTYVVSRATGMAEASEKHAIGSNTVEFADAIKAFLQQPSPDYSARIPQSLRDTVLSYKSLYASLL